MAGRTYIPNALMRGDAMCNMFFSKKKKKKKKVLIDLHALLKWDSMQDTMQRLLVIPETPKDLTCSSYDSTFLLLIPQRLFVLGNVFLHIRFNWLLSLSLLFFFLKCQRGGR